MIWKGDNSKDSRLVVIWRVCVTRYGANYDSGKSSCNGIKFNRLGFKKGTHSLQETLAWVLMDVTVKCNWLQRGNRILVGPARSDCIQRQQRTDSLGSALRYRTCLSGCAYVSRVRRKFMHVRTPFVFAQPSEVLASRR